MASESVIIIVAPEPGLEAGWIVLIVFLVLLMLCCVLCIARICYRIHQAKQLASEFAGAIEQNIDAVGNLDVEAAGIQLGIETKGPDGNFTSVPLDSARTEESGNANAQVSVGVKESN